MSLSLNGILTFTLSNLISCWQTLSKYSVQLLFTANSRLLYACGNRTTLYLTNIFNPTFSTSSIHVQIKKPKASLRFKIKGNLQPRSICLIQRGCIRQTLLSMSSIQKCKRVWRPFLVPAQPSLPFTAPAFPVAGASSAVI